MLPHLLLLEAQLQRFRIANVGAVLLLVKLSLHRLVDLWYDLLGGLDMIQTTNPIGVFPRVGPVRHSLLLHDTYLFAVELINVAH